MRRDSWMTMWKVYRRQFIKLEARLVAEVVRSRAIKSHVRRVLKYFARAQYYVPICSTYHVLVGILSTTTCNSTRMYRVQFTIIVLVDTNVK